MLFQGHLLLGLVYYLLFFDNFSPNNQFLFFFFVLLGSLLPDIDEENSKINQWSGFIGKIVGRIFPHRGFLHSIFFFTILFFVLKHFLGATYGYGLLLGYLAHLTGDCISLAGVRIFYPFRFKIKGPLRVGSKFETVLTILLFLLVIKLLVSNFNPSLMSFN